MANEATVITSLRVVKNNIQYQSLPQSFIGDVVGSKGPCVGVLTIPVGGKPIDLSELITPGYYVLKNIEDDDGPWVEYGIWDVEMDRFYPWGEIQPGEVYVGRFSRNVAEEYVGTGTGTTAPTNKVFFKAHGGDCEVSIEIFEA